MKYGHWCGGDQVDAMLFNELLKEHRKNEEQESKIELRAHFVEPCSKRFNLLFRRETTAQARDLFNLRSDLTIDVVQRDGVSACQLYLIKGY